jgi:hypothetical protein
MELLLITGLFVLAMAAIVGGALYWIWKKGRIGKIGSVAIAVWIGFHVVTAIWPLDSFYLEEYSYRSGLSPLQAAIVLDKFATYPDFHGDYYSEALIQLEKNEYQRLKSEAPLVLSEECYVPKMASSKLGGEIVPIGCWSYEEENDKYFYLVVFSDEKSIYFQFSQT